MSLHLRTLIVCAIGINLVGCLGESAEIKDAQKLIKKTLTDPESAQFTDLKYYKKSNFVCGDVNAKNQLGGYTGAKAVVVDLTRAEAYINPPRDTPREPSQPTISATFESALRVAEYVASRQEWQTKVQIIKSRGDYFDNMIQNKCKED